MSSQYGIWYPCEHLKTLGQHPQYCRLTSVHLISFATLDKLETMLFSLTLKGTKTVGGCVMSWGKAGIGGEETDDEDAWWAKHYHHKYAL